MLSVYYRVETADRLAGDNAKLGTVATERPEPMSYRDVQEEWRRIAPAWIKEAREGSNAIRAGLLDGPMMEACGDVRGLNVLDCGCGEGRFSRMLLNLGAEHVLGLDLCPPMIQAAKELESGKDCYAVADVQNLSFLGDRTFDLVVSYVNQCYLPDVQANNREVFRVLLPGGRFVVANLHPIRSAAGGCQTSAEGATQDAILDRYFQEGERRWLRSVSSSPFSIGPSRPISADTSRLVSQLSRSSSRP